MKGDWRDTVLPSLALFGSTSTLLCCALPAVLISLGAGAVMASLTSAIPGLMWLSAQKNLLFSLAGAMLLISSMMGWYQRTAPCPTDPEKAANCLQLRRLNAWLLITSWLAYGCGVFFAYVWVLMFF